MKFTFFVMLWAFIFALVCAGVCPPVAADIWTSGKVVYTTNVNGDLDIAVMGPNGEFVEGLTTSTDDEDFPTWSPDGTEVLYVRDNSGDEVWLMDDDGNNQRLIVAGAFGPSWAPDGNRFVAVRNLTDLSVNTTLIIYELNEERDGWSNLESIVSTGNPVDPAWSPDGKYIAYVAGGTGNPREGGSLYVYDVAADRSTKIVSGSPEHWMWSPTWGPQSYRIVFDWENAGFADGAQGIFAVRRDGGGLGIINWWPGYSLSHPTVAHMGASSLSSV